ncbi:MAG: T9SS type A sorting domain-containing protein [Armatimonadetes bacterium]|nr:T9SS type A sorting domain-containing protein [Armatimonadota bacterium]
MLSLITAANATVEIIHRLPCGNGRILTYMIIRDESTGKRWLIREWCDGTSWIDPLSTVSANPTGPITVSPNFSDQCDASQSITTPGANLGVTITDANNQTFEFRNCLNEQERAEGREAWEREFPSNPKFSMLKPDIGIGGYAEAAAIEAFTKDRPTKNSPGTQLGQEYFNRNYTTTSDDLYDVFDELAKDKTFFYIIKNNTDIAIEAAPAAQNNYQLTVRSVDPKVEVATEVLNSSGQSVWKNGVGAATLIDMSQLPSGTYFVKGTGQPIPVTIVR